MKNNLSYRQQYLAGIKRRRQKVVCTQLAIVALFTALWEWLTFMEIVDPFIFSSPSRIADITISMAQNDLGYHILVAVLETVAGFAIGFLLLCGCGFAPLPKVLRHLFLWCFTPCQKLHLAPLSLCGQGQE